MRSSSVKVGTTTYPTDAAAAVVMRRCEAKHPHKPKLTIERFWDEKTQKVRYRLVPYLEK